MRNDIYIISNTDKTSDTPLPTPKKKKKFSWENRTNTAPGSDDEFSKPTPRTWQPPWPRGTKQPMEGDTTDTRSITTYPSRSPLLYLYTPTCAYSLYSKSKLEDKNNPLTKTPFPFSFFSSRRQWEYLLFPVMTQREQRDGGGEDGECLVGGKGRDWWKAQRSNKMCCTSRARSAEKCLRAFTRQVNWAMWCYMLPSFLQCWWKNLTAPGLRNDKKENSFTENICTFEEFFMSGN